MPYDNTNRGALFKAEQKNPNSPLYSGTLNVQGRDYYISAWLNTSKKTGEEYLGLMVKPKEPKEPKAPEPQHGVPAKDFNDDIPF